MARKPSSLRPKQNTGPTTQNAHCRTSIILLRLGATVWHRTMHRYCMERCIRIDAIISRNSNCSFRNPCAPTSTNQFKHIRELLVPIPIQIIWCLYPILDVATIAFLATLRQLRVGNVEGRIPPVCWIIDQTLYCLGELRYNVMDWPARHNITPSYTLWRFHLWHPAR